MTNKINQNEEVDDGYSIPKIMVAVLILLLVGLMAYNYFENKRLISSLNHIQETKKQSESDLNTITEKYNLTKEDNEKLVKTAEETRQETKAYKDSIEQSNKIKPRRRRR